MTSSSVACANHHTDIYSPKSASSSSSAASTSTASTPASFAASSPLASELELSSTRIALSLVVPRALFLLDVSAGLRAPRDCWEVLVLVEADAAFAGAALFFFAGGGGGLVLLRDRDRLLVLALVM